METSAAFFITTARAGTQWIVDNLRRVYPDRLVAEHEPIRYAYRPKLFLRKDDGVDELRRIPTVSEHIDRVHEILDERSYVEVGFPCFALAPLLVEEFGSKLRIVHLIRHPVQTAASIATHHWYEPIRQDNLRGPHRLPWCLEGANWLPGGAVPGRPDKQGDGQGGPLPPANQDPHRWKGGIQPCSELRPSRWLNGSGMISRQSAKGSFELGIGPHGYDASSDVA